MTEPPTNFANHNNMSSASRHFTSMYQILPEEELDFESEPTPIESVGKLEYDPSFIEAEPIIEETMQIRIVYPDKETKRLTNLSEFKRADKILIDNSYQDVHIALK